MNMQQVNPGSPRQMAAEAAAGQYLNPGEIHLTAGLPLYSQSHFMFLDCGPCASRPGYRFTPSAPNCLISFSFSTPKVFQKRWEHRCFDSRFSTTRLVRPPPRSDGSSSLINLRQKYETCGPFSAGSTPFVTLRPHHPWQGAMQGCCARGAHLPWGSAREDPRRAESRGVQVSNPFLTFFM